MTADLPRITDTLNGRRGTVTEATPTGIAVVWDGGWSTAYTAADVTSGRFLFTLSA